jgi:hypothetical protein
LLLPAYSQGDDFVSNVIDFLHTLGQDADLRHASRQQLELALEAAGIIDPALRAALLGSDQRKLENLLGANTNVCAMIAPGRKDEEEEDEEEDDEDEDDDEDFDDDEDDEDFDDEDEDEDEDDEDDEDEDDLEEEEDSLTARLGAAGRVV